MKSPLFSAVIFTFLLFSCSQADEGLNLFAKVDKETISNEATYSELESELLVLVNNYRVEKNLPSLEVLNQISNVADEHTNYMISTGDVSHANFEERASNLIKNAGAKKVSENVAYGYSTAKSVLNGWLNSPEHKKIIETSDFTHFGISTESNSKGRNYFTQIFITK
ncbi:CAP domain-containing protein [Lutibacter citreus]|uniref:CAP domain-containing protein n=1 Tax=Lutibacter citreus TaxID=2138210 RepID=UPI000DBEA0D9|nr:CAP domain-containing protein [Lutibacter citreus]